MKGLPNFRIKKLKCLWFGFLVLIIGLGVFACGCQPKKKDRTTESPQKPPDGKPAVVEISRQAPSIQPKALEICKQSISQYGIIWTFDKPYPVGQFVSGDWWVIGPVTVVSVSPPSAPASAEEPSAINTKSIYGSTALRDDKRMRNGSMVVLGANQGGGWTKQGYDSRATNFDPSLSVVFPYLLEPNRSLISTISSETFRDGKLATPYMPGALMQDRAKQMTGSVHPTSLDTAAVLTCLDAAPPADAFRPAYAGTTKAIYTTKDIQWDMLPKLTPVDSMPDWEKMARIYQRPWLDHIDNWVIQYSAPGQNQPAYGGDVTNMNAYAALMLLLDVPQEQKEKLMIGFLQYGIDLAGLAQSGRQWFSDGGHWMGRKWPILFTSLMLDKPELRAFPQISPDQVIFGERMKLDPASTETPTTTLFSEDMDTYYGRGAYGQNALWQVVFHTEARNSYQEKPYAEWTASDKFQNNYMWVTGNWSAFALAALHMKAKAVWNHDAFFDFCEWNMQSGQTRINSKDGSPMSARKSTDPFVQKMWDTYRADAPEQPGGSANLRWVWTSPSRGAFRPE